MLEKIGLPPKPSARGRSWVIDASNCQNCASPFSIFNRKHHCRRCGGLFCGNCVQSRLVLRGQGDAPVRICEPCKKLEEAARFEARHGRKKKEEIESDDNLLKSLLGNDDGLESSSADISPETLRQKAQEARAQYSTLKKEGKAEEATKSFKRFKELERQADALALSLRKNARKATIASRAQTLQPAKSESLQTRKAGGDSSEKSTKSAGDEDLLKELKDLGWSDEKKVSDADILTEDEPKPRASTATTSLQMEILGHKRKALALKRDGKLAEAKEELKKAKVLEKRLEEIETLGEDVEEDDDGDEVTAVLRALEKEVDARPGVSSSSGKEVPLSAASLPAFVEEDETHVDVTETDMSDPDMVEALRAMGWAEEASVLESFSAPLSSRRGSHINRQELQAEILSLKRSALQLKRAGKLAEAREELKQAKSLEQMLEAAQDPEPEAAMEDDDEHVEVSDQDMRDPDMLAALQALGFAGDNEPARLMADMKKEKKALKEEVISVKRSSAAMHARKVAYQQQLIPDVDPAPLTPIKPPKFPATTAYIDNDDVEEEVTVQSLRQDPELASALHGINLDEKEEQTPAPIAEQVNVEPRRSRPKAAIPLPQKSKREIQRELLGIKRRALGLKREGKHDDAEKELKEASVLELQLKALEDAEKPPEDQDDGDELVDQSEATDEDMVDPAMLAALKEMGFKEDAPVTNIDSGKKEAETRRQDSFEGEYGEIGLPVDIVPPLFSKKPPVLTTIERVTEKKASLPPMAQRTAAVPSSSVIPNADKSSPSIEQQVLEHKKRALQFKRSGNIAAAKEELKQAKLLENQIKQAAAEQVPGPSAVAVVQKDKRTSSLSSSVRPVSRSKDRMKLQQESLAHKRKALALRKEGRIDEAEAEFEKAKALEKQLEEMDPSLRLPSTSAASAMAGVEDVLDPELLAALSGLGLQDNGNRVSSLTSGRKEFKS